MKKLIKFTFVAFIALAMVACGSANKEDFIGAWTPDLSSVDVHVSESIPAEYRKEIDIDEFKKELKNNQSEADNVKIEFKEDGTITVGPAGDTKDFKWEIDGDNLVISGTMDEGPSEIKGKDFNIAFEILDSSADEFTIKLTAASLMDQAKAQYEKEVEEALEEVKPFLAMIDLDAILGDTWATLTFKKKQTA